jgi:hypothetical protein
MTWRFHSEYYSHDIERLFDGEQPKMKYRSIVDGRELTACNLSGIKMLVKEASQ